MGLPGVPHAYVAADGVIVRHGHPGNLWRELYATVAEASPECRLARAASAGNATAVLAGDTVRFLQLLIDRGVDLGQPISGATLPLDYAAGNGSPHTYGAGQWATPPHPNPAGGYYGRWVRG